MKKFTVKDAKKEILNIDSKYDNFEVRDLNFLSKNYKTKEKCEFFVNSGYSEDHENREVFPRTYLKEFETNVSCDTLDDLIQLLLMINEKEGENSIIGCLSLDLLRDDDTFNVFKKFERSFICDDGKVRIYNVINKERE